MQSYVSPAIAYQQTASAFVLLYSDATAGGALTVTQSTTATGQAFSAPQALVEPVRTGYNPPPPVPDTDFVPGVACMPTGGLCVVAWGPGSLPGQAFDDAYSDLGLLDLRFSGSSYSVTDIGWPQEPGWGVSIAANDGGFLVVASDAVGHTSRLLTVPRSGASFLAFDGGTGSHGSSISAVWEAVYQRWFLWGTGNFIYGP